MLGNNTSVRSGVVWFGARHIHIGILLRTRMALSPSQHGRIDFTVCGTYSLVLCSVYYTMFMLSKLRRMIVLCYGAVQPYRLLSTYYEHKLIIKKITILT